MIDLKHFRKANKLGQKEVADFLGISSQFISAVECGRANLPDNYIDKLKGNQNGWTIDGLFVSESVAEPEPAYKNEQLTARLQNIETILQNYDKHVERLLGVIEKLSEKK